MERVLSSVIAIRVFRWLLHLERIDEYRMEKLVWRKIVEGRCRVDRG